MPRAVQEQAFQRGMIPFIPDDRKPPHPDQKERDRLYTSYDRLRRINTEHQSEVGAQLLADGVITPIARRLGLMDTDGTVFVEDDDDDVVACLAPALDLALYTPSADGTNAVMRYAEERQTLLTSEERRVLEAMGDARYSVFRIERKHEVAGTWLSDTIHGGEIWLMDRGLETSGEVGMLLGLRVFKAADFWISTGVLVPTGMTIMRDKAGPDRRQQSGKLPPSIPTSWRKKCIAVLSARRPEFMQLTRAAGGAPCLRPSRSGRRFWRHGNRARGYAVGSFRYRHPHG